MKNKKNSIGRMKEYLQNLHDQYKSKATLDGHHINVGIVLGLESAINYCDFYEKSCMDEIRIAFNDGIEAQIQAGDVQTPKEYYDSNYE